MTDWEPLLIVNTTYVVDLAVEARFIAHLTDFHIPHAIATGLLQCPQLHRILRDDEEDCVSYALQFSTLDNAAYTAWLEERGNMLQRRMVAKFGHSVVGFITRMEKVQLV